MLLMPEDVARKVAKTRKIGVAGIAAIGLGVAVVGAAPLIGKILIIKGAVVLVGALVYYAYVRDMAWRPAYPIR